MSPTTPAPWCTPGPRLVALAMIQAMLPEVAGRLRAGPEPAPEALEVIAQGLDQVRRTLVDPPALCDVIIDLSRHAAEALATALHGHLPTGADRPDTVQMQDWLLIRCRAVTDVTDQIATRTVGILLDEPPAARGEPLGDDVRVRIEALVAGSGDPHRLACALAGLAAGLLTLATGDLRAAKAEAHAQAARRLGGIPGGLAIQPAGIDTLDREATPGAHDLSS